MSSDSAGTPKDLNIDMRGMVGRVTAMANEALDQYLHTNHNSRRAVPGHHAHFQSHHGHLVNRTGSINASLDSLKSPTAANSGILTGNLLAAGPHDHLNHHLRPSFEEFSPSNTVDHAGKWNDQEWTVRSNFGNLQPGDKSVYGDSTTNDSVSYHYALQGDLNCLGFQDDRVKVGYHVEKQLRKKGRALEKSKKAMALL